VESVPEFAKVVQQHLRRTEWRDFPDVIVHAKEPEYFLVDDFIGQGGTLANLRGFVESQGAKVIGATALTGKGYSAKLNLSEETLRGLKGKQGIELEQWWIATFGYGFERLTESEARYLTRADDAHSISARVVAAARK
jgi:hypoxanthine-guanine phosphoribosyltransferase